MRWLSRLFKQQERSSANCSSVPIPDPRDWPTSERNPYPKKQGRPEEEFAVDLVRYRHLMRDKFVALEKFSRARAMSAGATHYHWRSCKDGDVCKACAKKDGKRFSYSEVPAGGHPAESPCGVSGL